ncbi:MAG: hypothetical protein OXB88_07455 [Bacteriovoracales bacterium]|nr:hypothetical protein [Bacteriovoracales bacterium]
MKVIHILFIDPLEKLSIQKDGTLLLAHTLSEMGRKVYLLFEDDFYILSNTPPKVRVFEFTSRLEKSSFHLSSFSLSNEKTLSLGQDVIFHIRLDPPFDGRYLKYLWMIDFLKNFGVKFFNDPRGILFFNEKISSFLSNSSLPSYIGRSFKELLTFTNDLKEQGFTDLMLKPLDLYQGMGIEKVSLEDQSFLKEAFQKKVKASHSPVLAQPFLKKIKEGEVRAVFFGKRILGTILKIPPEGSFLANIAQGASCSAIELPEEIAQECSKIGDALLPYGLYWLAYDILDGHINEVNVTCPGLLVEVSCALKRNLALDLVQEMEKVVLG